jgi:hypothetical protein
VVASLMGAHEQEQVLQMTNSREVVAIKIPRMGNIVQVIKPENELKGMVGEVNTSVTTGLPESSFLVGAMGTVLTVISKNPMDGAWHGKTWKSCS